MFHKHREAPRKSNSPVRTKASKLLLCKCAKTNKDYFLRLDKKMNENTWHCAYAFPYTETLRGDSSIVTKNERLNIGENMPDWNGCPFCKKESVTFCNDCGTVFCSNEAGSVVTCPGCHHTYRTYATSTFDTKTSSH